MRHLPAIIDQHVGSVEPPCRSLAALPFYPRALPAFLSASLDRCLTLALPLSTPSLVRCLSLASHALVLDHSCGSGLSHSQPHFSPTLIIALAPSHLSNETWRKCYGRITTPRNEGIPLFTPSFATHGSSQAHGSECLRVSTKPKLVISRHVHNPTRTTVA